MDKISQIQELQHYQLPDVKAISQNGDTVLHLVLKNENFSSKKKIEIMHILLEQGVDLNIENNNGETVLHLAITYMARDIVDFLLTFKRARETNFKYSVIKCMIESKRNKLSELEKEPYISISVMQNWECESASFVEWMMSKGFEIGASEDWALSMAIKFNLQHILPILLKYTTIIDEKNHLLHQFLRQSKNLRNSYLVNSSSIWYSFYCERYNMQIVKDLLSKGFVPEDIDANGIAALHMAIDLEERIDIIKMLIEKSKNINHKNCSGETAFYITINNWIYDESNADYYKTIADTLLEKGADVNESNYSQDNPLIIAVRKSKLHVIEFLFQCDANFNVTLRNGFNLIHVVLDRNSREVLNVEMDINVLDILIGKGCNVNAKDMNGSTPLHMATKSSLTKIVQKLIEHKAHLNCRDNWGWTPLRYTVERNRVDIADLLLRSGAIVSATDSVGNSTLHLAILYGKSKSMCETLLKFGADLNEEFSTLSSTIKHESIFEMHEGERIQVTRPLVKPEDEYLLKHWMKLKAANVKRTGDVGYEKYTQPEEYQQCYQKYVTEIAELRNTFIDDSVSLRSFLQVNAYSRCAYIKNEKLKNMISNEVELEKNFPEYSILILGKYREAVTKKSLLRLTTDVWLELTKIVLPDLCLDCIFSFLNNSDLFYFVKDHNELENICNVINFPSNV